MSLRPWEVQRFEGVRPLKRPAEIMGSEWHLPDHQSRMCVVCHKITVEGSGPLREGRCGPCWIATDPPHAA